MKKAIGYVYVIAAAVCWGFWGLFNRVLTAAGVSLLNMMPLRFGGTAILFTVFCMMFKQQVFHIKLRHLPIFLGSGLISMLLVLCGCALVSGIVGSDVGISLEGLLMGLASELCYGGYTIFTHYGMRYCDSFTMAYWTFLIPGSLHCFWRTGRRCCRRWLSRGRALLRLDLWSWGQPFRLRCIPRDWKPWKVGKRRS